MDNQRLVDLFNKIHQFDVWGFAVLDLEGEPVVVMDGKLSIRSILDILCMTVMNKVEFAKIDLESVQARLEVLTGYRDEIAEYCKESGIKPPYGSKKETK